MSVTAGFDVVLELAPDAIRDAIRANVALGGVRLNPPFEMQTPFGPLPLLGSGVSYTIVNSMAVTVEGERGVRIVLGFADSSIENDDPAKFTVYGLTGTVSILLQLQLIDFTEAGAFMRTIGYDPTATTVTVAFTQPSLNAIDAALTAAGLAGLGSAALITQAQQALLAMLGAKQTPLPGFSFRVTPGTDGGLFGSLQFERLELRNIGTRAIGIFGSCRVADHNRGNPTTLTPRPLPSGQNVRVTLAAAAFHTLAFCPAMGTKLGVAANAVPRTCGGNSPVAYGPGELVWIDDRFTSGGIVVTGMVRSSGDCVKEATVDFRMPFSVSVAAGSLAITPGAPTTGEPHVDYKWYCEVVAFLGGPLGIAAAEVARLAIADVAGATVKDAIGDLLQQGPGSSGFSVPNTAFTSVEMTPEAMTIGGATKFSIPPPDPPYITIRGDVNLVYVPHSEGGLLFLPNPQLVHRGIVYIKRLCIDGGYPVIERFSRLVGRYWLETYRIPRPIHRSIVLDSWDSNGPYWSATLLASAPLPTDGAGDVTIPAARCTYPFPLPDGTVVQQPVTVAFDINRRFISLFNDPDHGSYGLSLRLQVSNAAGLNETLSIGVSFVGDDVLILGTYEADLAKCIKSMVDKVNSYARSAEPRPWEPIEHPRPDEIFAQVDVLQRSGDPELAEISPFVGLAHQAAYLSTSLAVPGTPSRVLGSVAEDIGD